MPTSSNSGLAANTQDYGKHPTHPGMLSGVRKIAILALLAGVVMLLFNFFGNNQVQIPVNGGVSNNDFQPKPTRVKIEKLNVDATVTNLGLNADRTLEVPKEASEVGWYINSPVPGAMGPSVMVGHLDSVRGAAVFYNLKSLQPGDLVEVEREDGTLVVFKVDKSEHYSQDNFPTEKVYGAIDYAGIRLITCSWDYSWAKGRYAENLVVYGTLVDIRKI